MRKIILLLPLLTLNCGWCNQLQAHIVNYTRVCVDGVTYLQFPSGVTVQRDKNDKLVECN